MNRQHDGHKNRIKRQLNHLFGRFLSDESGSVLVMFSVFLIVMLGFSALVIDLGALRLEKTRLVNAVDAAALAGARELPSASQAEQIAREYADYNQVDTSEVMVSFGNNQESITVAATRERDFLFGKVLGVNSGSVQAQATATAGAIGSMTGVLPIGIQESVFIELEAGDGFDVVTKDKFLEFGPGNWGFIYLDGKVDTPVQLEYLQGGFDGTIQVGKIISTDTGSNINAQSEKILKDHANSGEILYIPIVEYVDGDQATAGEFPMEVKGFAAIIITEVTGKTSNMKISAIISPTGSEFTSGGLDPNAGYYGVQTVALIN
ncbi:MAG: pilus assembly protein TadG-related protein [Bacillota bacterium]|nr:pilus assembly protein TadG-related protein [Bacillota bacterium]MDW7677013.1 pilus assembly protein TadG-related protein [Bacillota bacterium]